MFGENHSTCVCLESPRFVICEYIFILVHSPSYTIKDVKRPQKRLESTVTKGFPARPPSLLAH